MNALFQLLRDWVSGWRRAQPPTKSRGRKTTERYLHSDRKALANAIAALPAVEAVRLKATGTEGKAKGKTLRSSMHGHGVRWTKRDMAGKLQKR